MSFRFGFLISNLFLCFLLAIAAGCKNNAQQAATSKEEAGNERTAAVETAPVGPEETLSESQIELLELAIDSATKIPIEPHIKDRSRAQQEVVTACLELDQPERAQTYADRIENWRRGLSYAELGLYYAKKGEFDRVQPFLDVAEEISETTDDWRRDRIRVRIAQTHTVLGESTAAKEFGADVVESEMGKVAQTEAEHAKGITFEDQFKAFEALANAEVMDTQRNALEAYAVMYKENYDNKERREKIEAKITSSWNKLPIIARMDLTMSLSESAAEHGDLETALKHVGTAQGFIDNYKWPLENRIEQEAELIKLRFKAGDEEGARAQAEELLALYMAEGETIVNIWRAGALRPLAEAYHVMGDRESALTVYRMAVEEGVENPNSRPRAEDLSATCCSMALHAVEPDAELLARIRQIHQELGPPW